MVNAEVLNDSQKTALSSALGTAAANIGQTLSGLLTKQTSVELSNLDGAGLGEAASGLQGTLVQVKMTFKGAATGGGAFVMEEIPAAYIADLMIGQDGSNPPASLTDLHLSAVSEVGSQMATAFAGALALATDKNFTVTAADLEIQPDASLKSLGSSAGDPTVACDFQVTMEGIAPFILKALLSPKFVQGLTSVGAVPAPAAVAAQGAGFTPGTSFPPVASGPVTVQPAQMTPMQQGSYTGGSGNLDLIMEVPLQITVELGRTLKTVREILALGSGSVVELEKLAGEPVDILVNEKPIARGEVVVIDENFGIRITEIINPHDRVSF
jgi:flagellar motor switch protein FliN/FliY